MNITNPSSPFGAQPEEIVAQMRATHDGLAEELQLSPDVMIQLYNQWERPAQLSDDFREWFEVVMAPLGVPEKLAFQVFSGQISTEAFVLQLDDDQLDRFDREFEQRQEAYMVTRDDWERQIIARNMPCDDEE